MKIYNAIKADMDSFDIMQAFPNNEIKFLNPFVLLHHGHTYFEGGEKPENLGVPPHPHRGFVPVSIILKGDLHHRDSLGNSSIIKAGGVQWTSSASGLIHSERPSKELAENGGELELIQLWVNLPAEDKMKEPEYLAWEENEIPKYISNGSIVSVISGSYEDKIGVAKSKFDIDLLLVEIQDNEEFELKLDINKDSYLYIISGNMKINEQTLTKNKLAVLGKVDSVKINVLNNTKILVMSGNDNGENVAAMGPFVMNSIGEAKRAFIDYSQGAFGQLIEKF